MSCLSEKTLVLSVKPQIKLTATRNDQNGLVSNSFGPAIRNTDQFVLWACVEEIPMGKISPVTSKYIVHANIEIEGVVDRPDVIGAIFGQTEGLLGSDLELRELQRSGRIGRIEVNTETKGGKTAGKIIIPSSLDKAETAIIGAALEVIQRIGPCNAKIHVDNIEDVRISKRQFVVERAKSLLRGMIDEVMPDSQELAEEVAASVRVNEIREYGKDRLAAGPAIDESEEVIVVEGRADVVNLLHHGFKNAIAINGTSVPETIIELSRKKQITAFVDGDRGGNLILKELIAVAEIDFVARAPDGKEVEELAKKEIHKSLRSRIPAEQAKYELNKESEALNGEAMSRPQRFSQAPSQQPPRFPMKKPLPAQMPSVSMNERKSFKEMLEKLIGTKGAFILDNNLNVLGKVPVTELGSTIKSLNSGVYAVVFDGVIEKDLVQIAEGAKVMHLVGMQCRVRPQETKIRLMTAATM